MRWEGPQCNCGHPEDIHWPNGRIPFDAPACRVQGCGCMAFSQSSTLSKPSSHAEAVLDAIGQGERREAERRAPTPAREREHQQAIIDLAKLRGWLVYHTHDSRRSEPGFPDLVLVRGDRCLFREIKTETGRVSEAQVTWSVALCDAGADWALWRMPQDWDWIVETLT